MMACVFPSKYCTKRQRFLYHHFKLLVAWSFFPGWCQCVPLSAVFGPTRTSEQVHMDLHFLRHHCAFSAADMLTFVGQMSLQGFNWASLRCTMFLYNILGLAFVTGYKSMFVRDNMHGRLNHQRCDDKASIVPKFLLAMDYVAFPCAGLVVMLYTGICFQVFMFSKLHEYDLLSFSGALAETFEDNTENQLPLLQEVEALTGDRLRHASETWVAATLRCVVILGVMAVFLMLQLLSGGASSRADFVWLTLTLVATLLNMVLLGFPMARVSEIFDYDVLKMLNKPLVLKHAQQHLGHQLLPHLHSLDWGFRVGGTVLIKRLVMTIAITALTSLVATVSQALARAINAS